ncbi:insulinase family protein [Candidatus Woesearchaeota archaeon]|nr:insulinase family protein [Candidatus Woesearchaeota archaeon]
MHKITLQNGLKIIFEHKKSNSVVVQVLVKVGSDHESITERGISHFIEHLVFEGTTHRPTNWDLSNEIEKVGGSFNAYTTNERTCFYVKVLKKHFPLAVEILADILQNPLFNPKELEKEKNVVMKEIDLVNDEPRFYQWVLLQQNLFEKHPARYPTYGDKKVIKGLNQEKIKNYFHKYYAPSNMVISVVGDVKEWKKRIIEKFIGLKGQKVRPVKIVEPPATKTKEVKEKKDVANTYIVIGFKSVPRNHPDSYVLEVIDGILGRGQSGRMFTEIRGKKGLAYDVGTEHISDINFGYFAVYATINGKNVEKVKKLILDELGKLQKITLKDLNESKTFIEGDFYLDIEDNQKVADQLLLWEHAKDAELLNKFIPKIKKVTIGDVKRVAAKYFQYYTMAVIEGK